MDICPSFVAVCETAGAGEQREGPLDAPADDPGHYTAAGIGVAATRITISLVGMKFSGPLLRSALSPPDGGDGVEQGLEHAAVRGIGPSQRNGQRKTLSIGDEVAFRVLPTAIGRARNGHISPMLATMVALSIHARL